MSSGELFSARVILAKNVCESLGMNILSYARDSHLDAFFTRKQPRNKDTLINISSTTHERKSPQRKSFFSPRYSQSIILNEKFNPQMNKIKACFSKIRALSFNLQKKAQGRRPPISPATLLKMRHGRKYFTVNYARKLFIKYLRTTASACAK